MKVYLDNNATTPVASEVAARIAEALALGPLNPGSLHHQGRKARDLFEAAKRSVLETMGLGKDYRVVFCGSASEAINLALRSFANNREELSIATSSVEHPAMARTIGLLTTPTLFASNRDGSFEPSVIESSLKEADLVATMYANNESGAILPIREIAELAKSNDIPLLIDGCQAPGKAEGFFGAIAEIQPDALIMSGHKIHAPVGIAALIVRKSFPIKSVTTGGSQQGGLRAGTEPVVLADAFALALRLAKSESDYAAMRAQKEAIWLAIKEAAPSAERTIIDEASCLSNTLHYRIPGISAERQILALDLAGVSVSSASACESGAAEPSKVMLGMGFDHDASHEGIRVSLSRLTSLEEVAFAISAFQAVLSRLSSQ